MLKTTSEISNSEGNNKSEKRALLILAVNLQYSSIQRYGQQAILTVYWGREGIANSPDATGYE
jgi:hypothetical protein